MTTSSFFLDNINKGDRVAVAMSGGVDSSVAAALMVEADYDVIGITLQLYDQGAMAQKKGACCAGQDIYDARQVADRFGFPHYVLDYESLFKQNVIDDFADSYMRGETPIPCVRCNQNVKFKDLLHTAQDLGAKALVTGHYVKRVWNGVNSEMHQAFDKTRDQSYFLFTTTQEQLDYLRFPLGILSNKAETRKHAQRFNLKVADKPDSQDICFVPNGNYASIVSKLRPGALDKGDIVHLDGRVLGQHDGIINYTIGQRKGLGVSDANPLYVIRLDAASRRVYVGPKEALAKDTIYLKDVNWLSDIRQFKDGLSCTIKIRSSAVPINATVRALSPTDAIVTFEIPEYGIAAGQAGVFYDGERLLGGGWICNREE
jgi:tRNA-specific 2-thiouridylase